MKTLRPFAVLLSALAFASCEKNAVQDITGSLPGSEIRFFNFGVGAPSVNFYANDQKVTAVLSTTGAELTTGVASGGVGSGGYYAGLTPGQYNFTGKISATVDKDLTIATVPFTLVEGKKYSLYLSGIYDAATKKTEGFVVEDPVPESYDYASANVRFVNAISNAPALTLYAKNTASGAEVAIGGPTAYKGASVFASLPTGIYDLSARLTGATTNVVLRTGVSFVPGRFYSISARGDYTVTSTTAATRPQLDFTANR